MKKVLPIGLVLLLAAGVFGLLKLQGNVKNLETQKADLEGKYAATRASEDSLRTKFDAALVSIAEIQDSLTAILPSESNVLHVSQDMERGGALTSTRKSQVLRTISDLNDSIRRSKEMIQRLEQRLKERNVKVASLERIVANLKKLVNDREDMIRSLTQRVETLKVQVAHLQTDVEEGNQKITAQAEVIETKRREISTIYYTIGTKRRLKEMGVVTESGGLIGLGKSTRLSGQFPEQLFNAVDTDAQTTIPVPGKRPVILSGQSAGSYQLMPLSVGSSELRITNAAEFRKVRYLVIQVDQ